MLKITEAGVQKTVSNILTLNKITHWRQNSGVMTIKDRFIRFLYWLYPRSTKKDTKYAFLDLAGIINGRFFSIEVKAPGEMPTGYQYNTIDLFRKHGCMAFYVDSAEMLQEKFLKYGVRLKIN